MRFEQQAKSSASILTKDDEKKDLLLKWSKESDRKAYAQIFREIMAYDAPFPSEIYRIGVRTLPSMGALIDEEKSNRGWGLMKQFDKPFLTVFGEQDMLVGTKRLQDKLIDNIPGAKGQAHDRIQAGHFIQESAGEEMAKRVIDFIVAN